jgi:hypothetical protein
VLVLFKVLRIKPTAFLIAGILVAGVLMIGGVVVAWALSSPISEKLVTRTYLKITGCCRSAIKVE